VSLILLTSLIASTETGKTDYKTNAASHLDPNKPDASLSDSNLQTSDLDGKKETSSEAENTKSSSTDSGLPTSGFDNKTDTTSVPGNTAQTGPIRPEHEQDKTGVTSAHQPSSGFASDKPTSSNATADSGPEPSVGADPASGAQPTQKQQGADRPHEEPTGGEKEAIKATKEEAEEAANVDTSGAGPIPLEQKAKEGGVGTDDGEDGPQKESHGSGTGEQYVKSSGMKADGGDFDAANPGAGKEADRLLEQKGVHKSDAPVKDADEGSSSTKETEEKSGKPGLKEKIKAKLHKH
jgi:hypothetical protein